MELKLEQIPLLADKFSAVVFDENATREIELLGTAFVWSDEQPDFSDLDGAIPTTKCFQYLIWYRKSLIQGQPFTPFTEYWKAFREACPTWPGFRPERCDPNLRNELASDVDATMKKLERVFEVCERKQTRNNNAV